MMENPFKLGSLVDAPDRKLPTSTLTSATLRLSKKGYIIRTEQYEIEDPFFKEWILKNVGRG